MVSRIFDILFQNEGDHDASGPVLYSKVEGEWKGVDTHEYRNSTLMLASAWLSLQLEAGDRVASIVRNGPEWNILDMSLLVSGLVHVPMYSTLSSADYAFILNEAGVRVLVIEEPSLWHRLEPLRDQLPRLSHVICMRDTGGCHSWSELLRMGDPSSFPDILSKSASISGEYLATIIYTSGTTGNPKGVMLTHQNLVSNFCAVAPISGLKSGDRALSVLPLCHVYERMLNYAYQYLRMHIFYAESFSSIARNLSEVSPDIFCAVPRILEKFYDRILENGRGRKGGIRCTYLRAVRFGLQYDPSGRHSVGSRILHSLFDAMIYKRWREAMGGRLRIIVSGGAALQPRLAGLFWAAGIKVTEGYGLTETSPVIAVNRPSINDTRIGTVGPLLPGVEVRIAEDGEILCKGPNVMKGYFLNETLTREVIDEQGWLHTGDIGCMVENRFLKITDRKKEIFKTSGGKYIAPQVIENKFRESSFIGNVMVIGENRHFPAAIIIPDFEYLQSWCEVKGHPWKGIEESIADDIICNRIAEEVKRMNDKLSQTEKIKRYAMVCDEWTQENGCLTPTLKLRRAFLKEKYIREILELYHNISGEY